MAKKNEEAQSEWEKLKHSISQKRGKRVGGNELSWDKDLSGNALLVLNFVAASFYDRPRLIRFSSTPQLKSLSPSVHIQVGKAPAVVTWSLRPSSRADKFVWTVDDDELGVQKTLTSAELSDAVETKLANYPGCS